MEMETLLHRTTVDLEMILCSLVAETSLQAQKFLLGLLLLIGSQCYGRNEFSSFPGVDHRFPFTQLTEAQKPDAEAKDAGEADETESDDDDDGGEEEEDDSGEEESDEEEDSDDAAEANGNSESDEDDEEEDEEDDDDDDDNEEDDDDEEEDEEQREPPSKKKK
ncbi:phosphopantothenoylcysteine decarboxylase subunit VHS3-like [Mangifera indica]|uniref:phosphopantothenoylcysteine decarboxylase subunit VHS3-like n=1 Tax=Mangifera indica TaxID=29780 RepID=UPI001CFB8C81|nr:phosphopantothenoylcysteine decarboxylase subunit VHS3-like [Mangifera indica]